jgi:hypothetical protein
LFQPATHFGQRPRRLAQPQQVAPQLVHPPHVRLPVLAVEHRLLDTVDFIGERLQHRSVIVDDEIEDRVQNIVLAVRKHRG